MFKFEKLKVWQRAINLSAEIHNLTREFPREELYIYWPVRLNEPEILLL
ncbi:MAG: four helix bundle protein [Candidatus Ratteibacteria bacterium]|nr:four helix bundle protein [Candidatus Ratteibacteria bacterium]